jgi:hypothetical protein
MLGKFAANIPGTQGILEPPLESVIHHPLLQSKPNPQWRELPPSVAQEVLPKP